MAGVNSPGDLCNFSPNQRRVILKGSASDRNVGLPLRKIECPLLHDQLDSDAWMLRMKAIKEAGFDDALADRHVAGQLDQAGGAVVERCRLALQGTDGRFNLFCIGQQLLAMRCQSVSTGLSFSKRAVESHFESP